MEFLSLLYTVLLVAICLQQALLLYRSGKRHPGRTTKPSRSGFVSSWTPSRSSLPRSRPSWPGRTTTHARHQRNAADRCAGYEQHPECRAGRAAADHGTASAGLEASNARKLEEMRKTLAESMAALQAQNAQKLDEIRCTVDEQLQDALQKRVTESFKAVNAQLEQVYKGLGEMQSLAADVGGLKQVLSGVRPAASWARSSWEPFWKNSGPRAVRHQCGHHPGQHPAGGVRYQMPGADGGSVWLPIDSKFPGDTYAHLQDAQASGDAQAVENARHALELVLRSEAKDIREKYVEPPYTTAFGILFLPFEGLYAEVVNAGLLEVLQRDYQVNVAAPAPWRLCSTACRWASRPLPSRNVRARFGSCWVPSRLSSTSSGRGFPSCSSVCARPTKSWIISSVCAAVPSAANCGPYRRWTTPALRPCWSWTPSRAAPCLPACRKAGAMNNGCGQGAGKAADSSC